MYAAITATLAAGLDGIDEGMRAAPACNVDLYEQFRAGAPMPERLPRDLWTALRALEQDNVLRQRVGEAFCREFLLIKSAEWDDYQRHVSDWELAQYASAF